jgi:hypothetical protein
MPTAVRSMLRVDGTQNILNFGPLVFNDNDNFEECFTSQITIPALTLLQVIGGSGPAITAITTIQMLVIAPNQVIKIGLEGVNGQSAGFTLNANKSLKISTGIITSLNVYNTTAVAAEVIFIIGGTA